MIRIISVCLCVSLLCVLYLPTVIAQASGLTDIAINPYLEIKHDNFKIDASFSYESPSNYDVNYRVWLAAYDENNILTSIKASDQKTILSGSNTCTVSMDIADNMKKAKAFVWTDDMTELCSKSETDITKVNTLKILAIGNSFSVDGMQWLYDIADSCGVDNIVLGNLYIGGCSLQTHWEKASTNAASYTYYKNTTGTWTTLNSKTMLYGITDETWDIITMQQASGDSGLPATYDPYLTNLIQYVNTNKTNPNAMLDWHMTWAYQANSTHTDFPNYGSNQMTMYNAIISTVQSKIATNNAFTKIIPVGTAIQNVRSSYIGDTLTRDGYHLSLTLGRYIAAMTWFHKLTGLSIDNVTYVPSSSDIPPDTLKIVKEAVNNAVDHPFGITQSKYTQQQEVDLNNYTLLDWAPTGSSYWYSTNSCDLISTANGSTATNLKYFISSKKFAKSDLPNGTLIYIDSGYQYRPEGWASLTGLNTNARPGNVTTNKVEITDSWWNNFNYRAFNLSAVGSTTDLSNKITETAAHFRIYVPKN